jgi:hypothetical protein
LIAGVCELTGWGRSLSILMLATVRQSPRCFLKDKEAIFFLSLTTLCLGSYVNSSKRELQIFAISPIDT